MNYLQKANRSGVLLLIDFEKAFNSLEWDYVRNVLQRYNFGPSFIEWYNILYNYSRSCVINNGIFSEFFNLNWSYRQGDRLSPYIFIHAIEPLAAEIMRNKKINGIVNGQNKVKLGQYADDPFVLDCTETSFRESIETFNQFYNCSC